MAKLSLLLAVIIPAVLAATSSPDPTYENGQYHVSSAQGTQSYTHKRHWDFSSGSRARRGQLPRGLQASNYILDDTPRSHGYKPSNVRVRNGAMELLVPGGQRGSDSVILGAEVETVEQNMLYASVRTIAVFSDEPGTCQAAFFYKNDRQESDIEFLSSPKSLSNPGGVPQIWFTNQDADGDGKATDRHFDPPADYASAPHEYRIDWTREYVAFFVDGEETWRTTKDVPSKPGSWLWNNWSNGDKACSAGPPAKDSVYRVLDIKMYYNTADD